MSEQQRFTEEFKIEAVMQITERQHRVADVAKRHDISSHSLNAWIKHYVTPETGRQGGSDQEVEIRRLKAELHRVTDERYILKRVLMEWPHVQSAYTLYQASRLAKRKNPSMSR